MTKTESLTKVIDAAENVCIADQGDVHTLPGYIADLRAALLDYRAADEPRAYADVKPFPFDPTAGADASNPYGKIVLTGPNGESIRLYLADRVDAALAVRLAGAEGCTKCGAGPAERHVSTCSAL